MNEEKKERFKISIKRLVKSFLTGLVIFAISFYLAYSNGSRSWLHYFINSLFIPGVLITSIGVLSVIKKDGFFDVFQFGMKQFGESIRYAISMKKESRVESDIMTFKEQKRSVRIADWEGVIVGSLFLVASIIASFFI